MEKKKPVKEILSHNTVALDVSKIELDVIVRVLRYYVLSAEPKEVEVTERAERLWKSLEDFREGLE